MSRSRLSKFAVLLGLTAVVVVPAGGSADLRSGEAIHRGLAVYVQGEGQQDEFTINEFMDEFEKRIPEPGRSTPSEIKRTARRIAKEFSEEADQRLKIRVSGECCPVKIVITISW